jgi:hypothetical protein
MKKVLFFLVFLLVIFNLTAQVNGDTLTVDGKKILRIWGSHYDRGYAHGYLMGDQIREIAIDYFIATFILNNPVTYNLCRNYFEDHFTIENRYLNEVEGIIDGMTAAGTNMYITVLDKDIESVDILIANSIVDLSILNFINSAEELGCSSLSAWGESTENDDDLNGNLVLTRNMDWSLHPVLLENHLLIVNIPTEENEISWVSFTFPGLIGALSGINSAGTAAFMNVGNIHSYSNVSDLHPIFLSVRNGLEHYDYNFDGSQNELDVIASVSGMNHLSGSIIHVINDPEAAIIETNNLLGSVTRYSSDNSIIPDFNLVATNHFRALYAPVYCYRYNNFADSLNYSIQQSIERNWNITTGAGGVNHNLHTIQFIPYLYLIKWSTASYGHPAYTLQPTEFNLEELLTINSAVENFIINEPVKVTSFPNPFIGGTQFAFSLIEPVKANLDIYNIKGQKIRTLVRGETIRKDSSIYWDGRDEKGNLVVSGIYFYYFRSKEITESGRLVVLK